MMMIMILSIYYIRCASCPLFSIIMEIDLPAWETKLIFHSGHILIWVMELKNILKKCEQRIVTEGGEVLISFYSDLLNIF